MLRLTPRAAEALRAADSAARRFNPDARVRLRPGTGPTSVATDLTDAAGDGESVVTIEGVEMVVADDLDGTLDADDHNAFSLTV
jgi:hypothetical protein